MVIIESQTHDGGAIRIAPVQLNESSNLIFDPSNLTLIFPFLVLTPLINFKFKIMLPIHLDDIVFLLNYKVKIFNTFYIYLYIFICICLSSHKGQYVQVRNNLCKSILLFCYVWLRNEIQVNRERYCVDPNWSILLQKKKGYI